MFNEVYKNYKTASLEYKEKEKNHNTRRTYQPIKTVNSNEDKREKKKVKEKKETEKKTESEDENCIIF